MTCPQGWNQWLVSSTNDGNINTRGRAELRARDHRMRKLFACHVSSCFFLTVDCHWATVTCTLPPVKNVLIDLSGPRSEVLSVLTCLAKDHPVSYLSIFPGRSHLSSGKEESLMSLQDVIACCHSAQRNCDQKKKECRGKWKLVRFICNQISSFKDQSINQLNDNQQKNESNHLSAKNMTCAVCFSSSGSPSGAASHKILEMRKIKELF